MTQRQIDSVKYEYENFTFSRRVLNDLILLIEEEHSKIMSIKTLKTFEKFIISNIEDIRITKSKSYGSEYYYFNVLKKHTTVFTFKILRNEEKLFNEENLFLLNEALRQEYRNFDYQISKYERQYSDILN